MIEKTHLRFPRKTLPTALMLLLAGAASLANAGVEHSVTGAGGYDLVSYHTGKKPLPGNGNHLSEVDGVTYLFSSSGNKKAFDRDPERFLPAYGGYCAYGVSVGKKFVGDPNVWEIVDGRLYLNLDHSIKQLWRKDIPAHIEKADQHWTRIREKHPSEL